MVRLAGAGRSESGYGEKADSEAGGEEDLRKLVKSGGGAERGMTRRIRWWREYRW